MSATGARRAVLRVRWLSAAALMLATALIVPGCGKKSEEGGKSSGRAQVSPTPRPRAMPTPTPSPSPTPSPQQQQQRDTPETPKDTPEHSTETYDRIAENPFQLARAFPLSTFSIDVDTAS